MSDCGMPKSKGVLAVDLDGTLAEKQHPFNPYTVGEPVPPVMDRLKQELASGRRAVLFTARASSHDPGMVRAVREWLQKHGLEGMQITCVKSSLYWSWLQSDGNVYSRKRQRHGGTKTAEYKTWQAMRRRCRDLSDCNYPLYGGRGIDVCDEWFQSFEAFCRDMGPRPRGTSLDRIDNAKGYFLSNCRWATARQQAENTRTNVHIIKDGETLTVAEAARRSFGGVRHRMRTRGNASIWRGEWGKRTGRKGVLFAFKGSRKSLTAWAAETGIPRSCLSKRIHQYNWSVETALTTPVDTSKHTAERREKSYAK